MGKVQKLLRGLCRVNSHRTFGHKEMLNYPSNKWLTCSVFVSFLLPLGN